MGRTTKPSLARRAHMRQQSSYTAASNCRGFHHIPNACGGASHVAAGLAGMSALGVEDFLAVAVLGTNP